MLTKKTINPLERVTGLEPATVCLEGRHSSQLSYTRILLRSMIFLVDIALVLEPVPTSVGRRQAL